MAAKDPQFAGRRACLDLAQQECWRAKGPMNNFQRGCFRSSVCEAVVTKERARELGYVSDGLCELCGELDTLFHRAYTCSGTEQEVRKVVLAWFWREARQARPNDVFWTRGIFPHLEEEYPRPESRHDFFVQRGEAAKAEEFDGLAGNIFIDGSCVPSGIQGLARAGLLGFR